MDFELYPIFVTVEDETEFNNVNNWTIPMTRKEIESLLDVIENEKGKLEFESLYLKSKDKPHTCIYIYIYIYVYININEAIEATTFIIEKHEKQYGRIKTCC